MASSETKLEFHLSRVDHHYTSANCKYTVYKETEMCIAKLYGQIKYAYFIDLHCASTELLTQLKKSKLEVLQTGPFED